MAEYPNYRDAAARTGRGIRSINRWRRAGMRKQREKRGDQRASVVLEDILLKWWRNRLTDWPTHLYRLRRILNQDDTRHATRDTRDAEWSMLASECCHTALQE